MPADVFISYSSANRDLADAFHDRLHAEGISAWIDRGGIDGAQQWSQAIVEAADEAKVMLLLVSLASVASTNVMKEVSLFAEKRKAIIPVWIERAELTPALRYHLSGVQRLDWDPSDEETSYKAVFRALRRLGISVPHEAAQPEKVTRASRFRFSNAKRVMAACFITMIVAGTAAIVAFVRQPNVPLQTWQKPQVAFYVSSKEPDARAPLKDWANVFEGNSIYVKCSSESKFYVMTFLHDSRHDTGRLLVTNELGKESGSRLVRAREVVFLPSTSEGWKLDDAVGIEFFFVLCSKDPLDESDVSGLLASMKKASARGVSGRSDVQHVETEIADIMTGTVASFVSERKNTAFYSIPLKHREAKALLQPTKAETRN